MEGGNETDDDKSGIRAQLLSLESSLAEKERRVAQLEQELSGVQAKCRLYRRECKQLSRELRSRRQDLRDCLRGACRPYRASECCTCRCHRLTGREEGTQTFATDFCSVESSGSVLDWLPDDGGQGGSSSSSAADVVREVVACAVQQSAPEYIYDQTSGLYFSVSSGYYYDPVQKLFYEPHSRTYYSYDENEKTYHFHSQLAAGPTQPKSKSKKHKKEKKSEKDEKEQQPKDLEEGEISSESSKSDGCGVEQGSPASQASDEENPERYPPSMRLVVKKSEKLATGSLMLVTFEGATVGRTEESGVCLLDNGISRTHARIEYSSEQSCYLVYDLGSQNGTFVNQKRLTEPKVQSEKGREIEHGDWVTFGTTELVAHVHSGHNTCDQCEPGLTLQQSRDEEQRDLHVVLSKEEREEQRREELRRMKKKYAVCDYEPSKPCQSYNDRAEQRRKTVGSSNPYEKDAEPSSVDKPVSEDNPGFRMLQKLGWKKGESLGQGDTGRREPINAYEDGQVGRAGLGTRTTLKEMCAGGDVQIVIVPSVSSSQS